MEGTTTEDMFMVAERIVYGFDKVFYKSIMLDLILFVGIICLILFFIKISNKFFNKQ